MGPRGWEPLGVGAAGRRPRGVWGRLPTREPGCPGTRPRRHGSSDPGPGRAPGRARAQSAQGAARGGHASGIPAASGRACARSPGPAGGSARALPFRPPTSRGTFSEEAPVAVTESRGHGEHAQPRPPRAGLPPRGRRRHVEPGRGRGAHGVPAPSARGAHGGALHASCRAKISARA